MSCQFNITYRITLLADEIRTRLADMHGFQLASAELQRARSIHRDKTNSPHEAYAFVLEEVDELWDEVKKKREERDPRDMAKELVQIAAMAIRGLTDLGLTNYISES